MGCATCWRPCRPAPAASSSSARPASTATPAASGSMRSRQCRPTHEAGRALLAAEEVLRASSAGLAGHHPAVGRALWPGALAAGRAFLGRAAGGGRRQPGEPDPRRRRGGGGPGGRAKGPTAADVFGLRRPAGPAPRVSLLSGGIGGPGGAAIPRADRGRRRRPAAAPRGPKRVGNARMLAELGVVLAYPSYREGLAASVGR